MKFSKEDINLSHTIVGGINFTRDNLTNATFHRPTSAYTKRVDLSSAKTRKTTTSKNDFPNVHSNKNILYDTLLNQNSKVNMSKTMEKEKLYEETLHLKGIINLLRHDLALSRGENLKKEKEINKKDKVLEDIVQDSQSVSKILNIPQDLKAKAKDVNLLVKMKKQFKELKIRFNEKSEECENLKKNIKNTKTNEMNLEILMLSDELNKLKGLYIHALGQIENSEKTVKDLAVLQENFSKQHFVVLTLQDQITKLTHEIKSRDNDILILKDNEEKCKRVNAKLKKDLNLTVKRFEFSEKTKNENNDVQKVRIEYETRIEELNKEVKYLKDIVDKKDRRTRDLENEIKSFKVNSGSSTAFSNLYNYNDIKYIQDNPDDKLDNITHLYKSKLIECLNEKEKLEAKNRTMEEKIRLLEGGLGYGETNNKGSNSGNVLTEEELNEFTYILLKNFEAKKINRDGAMNKILKDILTKYSIKDGNNNEIILSSLTEKIISIVKANDNDARKIQYFMTSLYVMSNEDMSLYIEKFLELFDSVKTYSRDEEAKLSKKIKKHLSKHIEYIKNSLKLYDLNKTGYISFLNFRKILETVKLRLKDRYIEYLINIMKGFDSDNSNALDDLKYDKIFDLISSSQDDSKVETSSEEDDEGKMLQNLKNKSSPDQLDEESEIVITTDQFNAKIARVIRSLTHHCKTNNISILDFFKQYIFKPETVDPSLNDFKDDALYLKDFVSCLKKIGVDMDTIDIYCFYTKFKFTDDFEAISVNILEKEVNKYPYNPLEIDTPSASIII